MSRGALSARQREVLDAIQRITAEKRRPPSTFELQRAMGLRAVSTITEHLDRLEERGWIRCERNGQGKRMPYSITVLEERPTPSRLERGRAMWRAVAGDDGWDDLGDELREEWCRTADEYERLVREAPAANLGREG